MLWDGRFGETRTNEGTEAGWEEIPENFISSQEIEVQAMQEQDAHRLLVDEDFVDTYGYAELFDEAFGDRLIEERYTR